MERLTQLAAQEIKSQIQNAVEANQTSDDLSDIQLWLDENKDSLPEKSEVNTEELFSMMKRLLEAKYKIDTCLNRANEWAVGLCEK